MAIESPAGRPRPNRLAPAVQPQDCIHRNIPQLSSAYLADQGLAPQTCRSYLAAVRSMQISLGLPDPRDHSSMPILKRVQDGFGCSKGHSPPDHTRGAGQHLQASDHPHRRVLCAISTTAFFGFSELPLRSIQRPTWRGATWQWIATTDPGWCKSITGSDVVVGRTDATICPVAAILEYASSRGARRYPS